jgi:ABC-type sugar transport system permease subunit
MIDGAGSWYRFKYITLVWIKPILFVVLIWTTLRAIAAFDLIYVLTGGGPADFTALISFFTYRETFVNFNFGHGGALSAMITILGFILILMYFKTIKIARLH